jgi:hypothetical protein
VNEKALVHWRTFAPKERKVFLIRAFHILQCSCVYRYNSCNLFDSFKNYVIYIYMFSNNLWIYLYLFCFPGSNLVPLWLLLYVRLHISSDRRSVRETFVGLARTTKLLNKFSEITKFAIIVIYVILHHLRSSSYLYSLTPHGSHNCSTS